jgi:hypothetical protein
MLQTFKIVRGIDKLNSENWFQMAAHAESRVADPDPDSIGSVDPDPDPGGQK